MIQSIRRMPKRFGLLIGILAAGACTGENLFTFGVAATALGPTLEITTPTPGFTIALGDSVLISATAAAPAGVTTISYQGAYATTAQAFLSETELVADGETAPVISNYLKASPGQVAGAAWIIVMVTDAIGGTVSDSVSIIIS